MKPRNFPYRKHMRKVRAAGGHVGIPKDIRFRAGADAWARALAGGTLELQNRHRTIRPCDVVQMLEMKNANA